MKQPPQVLKILNKSQTALPPLGNATENRDMSHDMGKGEPRNRAERNEGIGTKDALKGWNPAELKQG